MIDFLFTNLQPKFDRPHQENAKTATNRLQSHSNNWHYNFSNKKSVKLVCGIVTFAKAVKKTLGKGSVTISFLS
jgi:hypothetical protein